MIRKRGDSIALNSSKTRINAGIIKRMDEAKNSEEKEKQVTMKKFKVRGKREWVIAESINMKAKCTEEECKKRIVKVASCDMQKRKKERQRGIQCKKVLQEGPRNVLSYGKCCHEMEKDMIKC